MKIRLKPRRKRSALRRALDTVSDSLDAVSDVRPRIPGGRSSTARKAGLLAAAGAVGLTAGSAGVSSVRRRAASSNRGS